MKPAMEKPVAISRRSPRLPMSLKLRANLRWSGELTVISHDARGYVVGFNAHYDGVDGARRFIYDRTMISATQLEDWTGWKEQM